MSIQKINSPSFGGIRKIVKPIVSETEKQINKIKKNLIGAYIDEFRITEKSRFFGKINPKIKQITGFFAGKKNVGAIVEYADKSFMGVRTFADGTKAKISGAKHFTVLFGEIFLTGTSVSGKNILSSYFPHNPLNKKGQLVFPTLKAIKEYNKPSNIIKLIKEGKLKIGKTMN